ncbi:GNAT family N-acetyltransferase [Afifella sp. IM 167]|uniref:GNAT family N-acetyltransferase n=1 Tax=Afifella sp. IM 167 TaxID=2033586 RepID=UPI001CC9F822|nr:GNAT family N-acyltransferase [Afifella sp. IM 167]
MTEIEIPRGREAMQGRQNLSPKRLVRRFAPGFGRGRGTDFVRPFAKPGRAPWRAARHLGSLGRLGDLEARLARSPAEIRRSQALRYHVFYEEMSAVGDAETHLRRRDADAYDLICDHLLVLDHAVPRRPFLRSKPEIVGTYRLLRQEIAELNGGFYSAGEYDIAPLVSRYAHLNFLELGRSCVLKPYRDKRTVELLWHGVWSYILLHQVDVMFGCASFAGTDPEKLALPLSFLHHHARAPEEWNVSALPERYVDMNRMAKEEIDPRAALRELPPLIKGYLRLGAYIGDGAVVDYQFGTTDIMIILPVSALNPRYVNHFGNDAERYGASQPMARRRFPLRRNLT